MAQAQQHFGQRFFAPQQGGLGGALGEAGRMRDDELIQLRGASRQIRPRDDPAQAPAGHSVGFGERLNHDDRIIARRPLQDGRRRRIRLGARVVEPLIDFVRPENYSPGTPQVPLDAELIERVFYNLLLNAAQASKPQGHITLKTRLLDNTVEIAVIDRGSGIDPKNMESVFNPFFTTKSTDEHGGKITVESEPGAGTVLRVFLRLQ